MFGSIGMPEMLVILVIALLIFGPRKLPDLGKSLGRSLAEFKRASNDLRNTLEEEIRIEERHEQIKTEERRDQVGHPPVPETPAATQARVDHADAGAANTGP